MVPLCPVCDEPLLIVEFEDVEADYCASCLGVWLDEGELELLGGTAEHDALVEASERVGESASKQGGQQQGATDTPPDPPHRKGMHGGVAKVPTRHRKRRCPRCNQRLAEAVMGRDPQIHLDRCAGGHGLWFDRGELRGLLSQWGPGAGPSIAYLEQLFGQPGEPNAGEGS